MDLRAVGRVRAAADAAAGGGSPPVDLRAVLSWAAPTLAALDDTLTMSTSLQLPGELGREARPLRACCAGAPGSPTGPCAPAAASPSTPTVSCLSPTASFMRTSESIEARPGSGPPDDGLPAGAACCSAELAGSVKPATATLATPSTGCAAPESFETARCATTCAERRGARAVGGKRPGSAAAAVRSTSSAAGVGASTSLRGRDVAGSSDVPFEPGVAAAAAAAGAAAARTASAARDDDDCRLRSRSLSSSVLPAATADADDLAADCTASAVPSAGATAGGAAPASAARASPPLACGVPIVSSGERADGGECADTQPGRCSTRLGAAACEGSCAGASERRREAETACVRACGCDCAVRCGSGRGSRLDDVRTARRPTRTSSTSESSLDVARAAAAAAAGRRRAG